MKGSSPPRHKKYYSWARQHRATMLTLLAIFAPLVVHRAEIITLREQTKVLHEELDLQQQTSFNGRVLEVNNLSGFTKVGNIINSSNVLSLGKSNQAYFLSSDSYSEHAIVTVEFIPMTEASDFYLLVQDSFQLILGDGDRQAIALKTYPDWQPILPKEADPKEKPRYYLKHPFTVGHTVRAVIDVSALRVDGGLKTVDLRLSFYQDGNQLVSAGDGADLMEWSFINTKKFNNVARYGVGLIDPSAKQKPRVQFQYLRVEEKQQ